MQAWGLIVLLVSKAAGHSSEIPDMEQDKSAGVLHRYKNIDYISVVKNISKRQLCQSLYILLFYLLLLTMYFIRTQYTYIHRHPMYVYVCI